MLLVLVPCLILLLQGLGTVILTKWSSKHAHCLAQSRPEEKCTQETEVSLEKNFAFKHIKIKSKKFHGILHSEIDAKLLSRTIRGSYDLEPSEYKRVQ